MDLSIFEFLDYKRYLHEVLSRTPTLRHGGRLRVAEAVACKPGYVTQVLNHDANFSLEQAEKLSKFLSLEATETQYLILIVNYARAGTKSLRDLFMQQISAIRSNRANLKDRAKPSEVLSPTEQAIYYSSWHFAVIHILCTITNARSREAVAERTGLDPERAGDILVRLERLGLIERSKESWHATSRRVFIDKDSPFNYRHHANFRTLAVRHLDRLRKDGFHYSGVHSLAKEDSVKIIELIRRLILDSREIIKESPAEDLVAFNIDFFSVD